VLSGLADDEADKSFNRLMQYLELSIRSAEDALSLFDYWLRVARGERVRRSVVSDQLSALSVAAEKFRSDRGRKISLAEFQKWRQAQAVNLSTVRPPIATLAGDSAVVRFWLLDGVRLVVASVTFSSDGRVDQNGLRLEPDHPLGRATGRKNGIPWAPIGYNNYAYRRMVIGFRGEWVIDFGRIRSWHADSSHSCSRFVAVRSFNKLHQVCRIRLKQKQLKTGGFRSFTESALGAGGRAFKSPRPDQWNQLDMAFFLKAAKSTVVDFVDSRSSEFHRRKTQKIDPRRYCGIDRRCAPGIGPL
jgi:hypothetical protein